MSKKLRILDPINIAPEIIGWLDEDGNPNVTDNRTGRQLDPRDIYDKIYIYERQVKGWFLSPATNLIRHRNKDKGFIVLMICLSYLEGIEQYRRGDISNGRSPEFFIGAIERLYPSQFQSDELRTFYSEARCGLFHNGMVRGKIVISNGFHRSIEFDGSDIKVSPSKFLDDIKRDFDNYLEELRTNEQSRFSFDRMYSNI